VKPRIFRHYLVDLIKNERLLRKYSHYLIITHGRPDSFKFRPVIHPLQIFTKFDTNPTICQPNWKMYLMSDSHLSKLQLSYSSTDFHQIRHQLYPLTRGVENDFLSLYLIQVQVGPKYNFFIPWAIFTKFDKSLPFDIHLDLAYLLRPCFGSHIIRPSKRSGEEPASTSINDWSNGTTFFL